MNATEWIAAHAESTPPALLARVREVLAADAKSSEPASEQLLRAGKSLLAGVLSDADSGREVALDLLAADACVTWAFEAAADETGTLPERAERAMQQIAELAK